MVERGQFRADLYYRLNVIPLSLPPLARTPRRHSGPRPATSPRNSPRSIGTLPPRLHPDFLERLQSHSWPGNVRELANFMRRVLTLSDTSDIDARCFEMEFQGSASLARPVHASPFRRPAICRAAPRARQSGRWKDCIWKKRSLSPTATGPHAAEMLGISLRTLRNKIREYGLPPRRYA